MTDYKQSVVNICKDAQREIIDLRRQNEILKAKSQVVDAFALALNARPPEKGYGIDTAAQLQKVIDTIPEKEIKHPSGKTE